MLQSRNPYNPHLFNKKSSQIKKQFGILDDLKLQQSKIEDLIISSSPAISLQNTFIVDSYVLEEDREKAEKGNPAKPFQSYADIIAFDNLVDGDTIIFRAGPHTLPNPIKGNVNYIMEDGFTTNSVLNVVNEDLLVYGPNAISTSNIAHQGTGKTDVTWGSCRSLALLSEGNVTNTTTVNTDDHYYNIKEVNGQNSTIWSGISFNNFLGNGNNIITVNIERCYTRALINMFSHSREANVVFNCKYWRPAVLDGNDDALVYYQTGEGLISDNFNVQGTVGVMDISGLTSLPTFIKINDGETSALVKNCVVDLTVNQFKNDFNAVTGVDINDCSIVSTGDVANNNFKVTVKDLQNYPGYLIITGNNIPATVNNIFELDLNGNILDNDAWGAFGGALSLSIDDSNLFILKGKLWSDNQEDLISGLAAGAIDVRLMNFTYKSPGNLGTISKSIYLDDVRFEKDIASPNATADNDILNPTVATTVYTTPLYTNVLSLDGNLTIDGHEIRNTNLKFF
jgi:hypothetical protein